MTAFGKVGITDKQLNNSVQVDMYNALKVEEATRMCGTVWDGTTIDTSFWTTSLVSGGTAVIAANTLNLRTNTTANGASNIFANRFARYIPSSASEFGGTIRISDAGTVNNKRRWGALNGSNYLITISSATVVAGDIYTNNGQQFEVKISGTVTSLNAFGTGNPGAGAQTYTKVLGSGPATLTGSAFAAQAIPTDGFFFQLNGTTFSIGYLKNGSETLVDNGSFNGEIGATYTLTANFTKYKILYSNSKVVFYVGGLILHTLTMTTTPLTGTLTLTVGIHNVNSGGITTDLHLEARNCSISRLGKVSTLTYYKNITTAGTYTLKLGGGLLHNVLTNNQNLNVGTAIIYDGVVAAGNIIATIGILKNNTVAANGVTFDVPFFQGLTIVTDQAQNLTIIYE